MADSIHVKLPDGSVKEVPKGTTALDVAKSISPRLADAALAAKTNGDLIDLTRPLEKDTDLRILTDKDPEALEVYRHSSAHLAGGGCAGTVSRDQARPRARRPRTDSFTISIVRLRSRRRICEKIEKKDAGAGAAEPALRARISAAQRRPGEVQGRRRLHEVPLHRAVHQAR